MNDQDKMFEAATETPAFLGCPAHIPNTLPSGFDGTEPLLSARRSDPTEVGRDVPGAPEVNTLSEIQREEARQKRKIHWTAYPTKVDVCVMGKTEQNGKVYEVRIAKRGDSKVKNTYGQCKVNGKTVLTCSFTGSAWMLKRILTEGMQALVNYKAKRKRDSRRNYKRRDAAAEQGGEGVPPEKKEVK